MLRIVLRAPWKVHAVFTVIFLGLAFFTFQALTKVEQDKARALQEGIPAAVSLNDFDPKRDVHPADEVHVIGWINFDHNYALTETRKRKTSSYDVTRRMFVLFGPEDETDSLSARAVVLLREGDVERFKTDALVNFEEMQGERLVFRLNGTAERKPELYEMANDALAKQGLSKAPGFQFIEIWGPKGRESDLAPDPNGPLIVSGVVAGIGVFFLLIGIWRFRSPYRPAAPVAVLGEDPGQPEAKKKRVLGLKAQIAVAVVSLGVIWSLGQMDKVMFVLPLVVLFALYLGMRQMGRAVSSATGRALGRKPAGEAGQPADPQALARSSEQKAGAVPVARDAGPVQSLPAMSDRLLGLAKSPAAAKWMPFAVGVVVLFVSPKLFDVPNVVSLGGRMVTAPQAVATVVTETAVPVTPPAQTVPTPPIPVEQAAATGPGAASQAVSGEAALADPASDRALAFFGLGGLNGLVFPLALAALAAAVLLAGLRLNSGNRRKQALSSEPLERWEKIARQARAGRTAA